MCCVVPLYEENFCFDELLPQLLHDHLFAALLMDTGLAAVSAAAGVGGSTSCGKPFTSLVVNEPWRGMSLIQPTDIHKQGDFGYAGVIVDLVKPIISVILFNVFDLSCVHNYACLYL